MPLFGGNRSVAVRVSLDPRGVVTGAVAAGKAVQDFAKAADQAVAKHSHSFDRLGSAATKAGLVIGAGAVAAVVSYAQFDKSLSRAQAGTQATAAEMDALRKAALKAGADTQFSATESADAITAMGKAGVGVQDILGGGLTGALSLAAAGELEVKDAAEIAATALTQFGLSGKELPHVADLLAAGAGKAQGDVTDLANALKYVGPVAHAANIPIEQTVGVLAEFASQGIISEQAGTSFRGVLLALQAPSALARKEIDALGLKLYDSKGRFLGIQNAAQQLQLHLGGLSEAERDAALGTIFGNEQVTAATILYKGGGQAIADWTKKVNDAGYAQRQAGQLMNNLAGDVEQLKGSLETALIQSGSGANSGLRTLTQTATGAVNAFGQLPPEVQQSTVVIAGLTAGTLLLAGGLVKGAVAARKMRTDLAELGVTGERTSRALGLIAKGAAALTVLSFVPDINRAVDQGTGAVSGDLDKMQLDLANFAKGAALGGEAAKTFGADLKGGIDTGVISTQNLRNAVNDLSGANGFFNKPLPFLGSQEGEQIDQIGKALAGLAQGGHADTAATAFDRLAKAGGLNEEETKRLLDLMPEYSGYLSSVAAQQVATGDATAGTADATSVLKQQMGEAGYQADQLKKSLDDVRDSAKKLEKQFLDQRAAARGYQQSLQDARDVLNGPANAQKKITEAEARLRKAKTPGQRQSAEKELDRAREAAKKSAISLDITTEAGRKAQAALDGVAEAAQNQADKILDAGGTDAQYRASLESSRQDLVKLAEKFGLSATKAQEYTDKALAIPAVVKSDVQITGLDQALVAVDGLYQKLVTVNGKKVAVSIRADASNVREDRGGQVLSGTTANRIPSLGSLPIPRRAGGGSVRAGGEYVVGERGWEIFRPGTSGTIVPHQAAAASSVHVVRVPVHETHTQSRPVSIQVGQVVTRDAGSFTNWGRQQAAFGAGGVS